MRYKQVVLILIPEHRGSLGRLKNLRLVLGEYRLSLRTALAALARLTWRLRRRFERTLLLPYYVSVRIVIIEIAVLLYFNQSRVHGALDSHEMVAEFDEIKCNCSALLINLVNPLPFW